MIWLDIIEDGAWEDDDWWEFDFRRPELDLLSCSPCLAGVKELCPRSSR